MHDFVKVTGHLIITLYHADGTVKQRLEVPNLVVNAGKNLIASRLVGTSSGVISHMGVGTSNASVAAANTTLANELTRVAVSSPSISSNVITYVADFGAGVATGNLYEAALFNSSSGGTMLCRTTFTELNKTANDHLIINWNVTIN